MGPGRPPKAPNMQQNATGGGRGTADDASQTMGAPFAYFPDAGNAAHFPSHMTAPLYHQTGPAGGAHLPYNLAPSQQFSAGGFAVGASAATGGLVDILNQLDSERRSEMLGLVTQLKSRALAFPDFLARSRELLGERLYGQLSRDMNVAIQQPGGAMWAPPRPPASNTMHSMPSIYPPGVPSMQMLPPSMLAMTHGSLPAKGPAGATSATASVHHGQSAPSTLGEVDVSKMDTSSLQDVLQYSGVDLKAEAEALYREQELAPSAHHNAVDNRLKFDYFFNAFKFRAIIQATLQRHFLQTQQTAQATGDSSTARPVKPLGITEDVVHLLSIAIQKRLVGVLRRLAETSRHRVDYGRGRFKIKIENDPKKQLWLQERLFVDGVGEEQRRASAGNATVQNPPSSLQSLLDRQAQNRPRPPTGPSISAADGASAGVSASGGASGAIGGTSGGSSSGNASTGGAVDPGATSGAKPSGGDDMSVKTKLANVTAMAALGLRQKSWMATSGSGAGSGSGGKHSSSSTSTATSVNSNTMSSGSADASMDSPPMHPLSQFHSLPSSTPLTDSELHAQYTNRTISTVDLITCLETDPHLRRSRLLAVLYDSLPRENRDGASEKL